MNARLRELRNAIWTQTGYTPSIEQLGAHDAENRYKIVAGGEQSGKSFSSAKELVWQIILWQALHTQDAGNEKRDYTARNGLWWVIGPTYDLARPEFGYLVEDLILLGMIRNKKTDISFPKEGKCVIRLPFGLVETKSAEEVMRIAAYAPDGILTCEAAQMDYYAWLKILGRSGPKRAWVWASGCISGDSLVHTSDGIREIQSLGTVSMSNPDVYVRSISDVAAASYFYVDGATETIRIRTQKGFELEGTPNHRVMTIRPDGGVYWVELSQLNTDDYVAIQKGIGLWGNGKILRDPYLFGLYIAEGCCDGDRITIGTVEPETELILESSGFTKQKDSCHWRKTDHKLCDDWRALGLDTTLTARDKVIPSGVLSAGRFWIDWFLRGLFDGDGCAHKNGRVTYATASIRLAKQLQALLLSYGIVSAIHSKTDNLNGKEFESYIVDVGTDSIKFYDEIGFGLKRKQSRKSECKAKSVDRIPHQRERIRQVYKSVRKRKGRDYDKWRHLAYGNCTCVDKSKIVEFLEEHDDDELEWLVKQDIYWARVVDKQAGFAKCYDLVVPGERAYTANGFVVHNTFESSIGWYPEWWVAWQGANAQDGKSFSLPSWSNLALYPGGRDDPEIRKFEATFPPDWFQERFGAVPCPPRTLVFKEFSPTKHVVPMHMGEEFEEVYEDGRLVDVILPWDHDVEIWIDPGRQHAYAVLAIMRIGDKVYHFDEVWETGKTAREIIEICRGKSWWRRVNFGIIDVAGRQHHEGESHVEIWAAEAKINLVSQTVPISDGIERHRSFLERGPEREPHLYHSVKCQQTIWEYGKYKYPELKEDRPARDVPIDANNDAMKALAYGLCWHYGFVKRKYEKRLWTSPFSDWTDGMKGIQTWLPEELR